MSRKPVRTLLVVVGLVSYGIACASPALRLASAPPARGDMTGLEALIAGVFMLFVHQFAWLANPLALVALLLLLLRRPNASLLFSLAALLVAQHAWALVGTSITRDDTDIKYQVTALGAGFFLWVMTFLLFAAASVLKDRNE